MLLLLLELLPKLVDVVIELVDDLVLLDLFLLRVLQQVFLQLQLLDSQLVVLNLYAVVLLLECPHEERLLLELLRELDVVDLQLLEQKLDLVLLLLVLQLEQLVLLDKTEIFDLVLLDDLGLLAHDLVELVLQLLQALLVGLVLQEPPLLFLELGLLRFDLTQLLLLLDQEFLVHEIQLDALLLEFVEFLLLELELRLHLRESLLPALQVSDYFPQFHQLVLQLLVFLFLLLQLF